MELLDAYDVPLEGANAVIVGRSEIVGKPQALLLLERNATVTICHSRTRDLPAVTRAADVLVVAIGRPRMIGAEHVGEGAVVIDVGINRLEDGLAGDVDFEAVQPKARLITPVPGGVGPMTIAMLLREHGRRRRAVRRRRRPALGAVEQRRARRSETGPSGRCPGRRTRIAMNTKESAAGAASGLAARRDRRSRQRLPAAAAGRDCRTR